MVISALFLLPLALLRTVLDFMRVALGRSSLGHNDHFAPHPYAGFEGYYSRTQLEDGGTLAVIFCWVKDATTRKNLVCITYAPLDARTPPFQYDFYPDEIIATTDDRVLSQRTGFLLRAPGIGTMAVSSTAIQYEISVAGLTLSLRLTNSTPWSKSDPLEGPMGPLAHLSRFLPLNWHVHSTASDAEYEIKHAGRTRRGSGITHMEKNWGTSFPAGWIWSQSFGADGETFSLAGGEALPGTQAYLLGYRSSRFSWDFRPPFTIGIYGFSPFMSVHRDSRSGTVNLTVHDLFRKLIVSVSTPPDSFNGLPAPLRDGHRPNFAFESFRAKMWIELQSRRWPWEDWVSVEAGRGGSTLGGAIPSAALEFGGSFHHLVENHVEK